MPDIEGSQKLTEQEVLRWAKNQHIFTFRLENVYAKSHLERFPLSITESFWVITTQGTYSILILRTTSPHAGVPRIILFINWKKSNIRDLDNKS